MKCSTCGKKISFFLAYKSKHSSGRFCSQSCALAATGSSETTRGGVLELICFCIYFPVWLLLRGLKLLKNKWVLTIFSCGMTWALWKMLNAVYGPKAKPGSCRHGDDGDDD